MSMKISGCASEVAMQGMEGEFGIARTIDEAPKHEERGDDASGRPQPRLRHSLLERQHRNVRHNTDLLEAKHHYEGSIKTTSNAIYLTGLETNKT